jgi:hypothetical protein
MRRAIARLLATVETLLRGRMHLPERGDQPDGPSDLRGELSAGRRTRVPVRGVHRVLQCGDVSLRAEGHHGLRRGDRQLMRGGWGRWRAKKGAVRCVESVRPRA